MYANFKISVSISISFPPPPHFNHLRKKEKVVKDLTIFTPGSSLVEFLKILS